MFSLRMLMAVVAISAVYIAGMVYRTEWWEAAILTMTYVIYAGATTALVLSRERRAFYVAFVVFGVAYALCVYFRLDTLTKLGLQEYGSRAGIDPQDPFGDPFANPFASYSALMLIGHSFFAFLFSLVAGVVAEAVVRRNQKPAP